MADAEGVRALARQMTLLAAQARTVAKDLRTAEGVEFVSHAAERYRKELRAEAKHADAAAHEIDAAARALFKHAAALESHLAKLASAAEGVKDAITDVLS
jgi:hypothetical protein